MVFSLFPRKSASALLFRETVQTQYLNKRKKKVHKNIVVPSKHFSNPPILKLLSVCLGAAQWIERSRMEASRTVQESTWRNRVVEKPQNQHGRAREVRHADRTRTDVRGPKHPGLVGAGCQKLLCRGRLLLLCVCAWGAELAVGRVRCTWGKRGIAWRGANGARAVGAPPPRVVTACGRGRACGLAHLFAPCSRGSLTRVCVFAPQT